MKFTGNVNLYGTTHKICISHWDAQWISARWDHSVAVASGAWRPGEKPSLIFRQKFPAGCNTTRRRCGFTADTVRLMFCTKRQQCNSLPLNSCLMFLCHVLCGSSGCVLHSTLQYLHPYKQRRVNVQWEVKKMRAAVSLWETSAGLIHYHEAGSTFFSHPPPDKHLSPPLFTAVPSHLSSPPPPPFFPHPLLITLSFFFYGWVVIFPWDSSGGELSRMHCFIIPNKTGNKFRPPQLELSDENLAQKLFFSCSVSVCHVASFLSSFQCLTPLIFHPYFLFFKVTSMDFFSLRAVKKSKWTSENKHI